MSHLVKPTAFRAGKTYLWQNNVLLTKDNSDSLFASGLNSLSSQLFNRKRLYLINSSLFRSKHNKIAFNILYAPKIKARPRNAYSLGGFARRVLQRSLLWPKDLKVEVKKIADRSKATQLQIASDYVFRKKQKIAKLPRRKHFQINKWLTRRMFRGAARPMWMKAAASKIFLQRKSGRFVFKHLNRLRCKKIRPFSRWRFDRVKSRRFNNKRFSLRVSRILSRNIKVKAVNVFAYFALKGLITFKTQQRHIWNYRYRRWRYQYKNYFDVVNGFLIISLIDQSENFLINVLKATLPQILKIRKFFYFLSAIIKNMPDIKNKYSVFKMMLAGKIAGGTKRTKSHTIGYGILPVQTLALKATSNFLSYAHVYGEFGLKMLMCKDPKPELTRGRWR